MEPRQVAHYRIERLIARGGMGEVYEAQDLTLGRRVALKFVAPELAANPESLKRFEREALAAAALNHPHIATLHALEKDGERPFIAMELLSGPSLRELLAAGPLPIDQATAIVRDVAEALAYAHGRGVVHRDIKPENLMFGEHDRIKITDFGLARAPNTTTVTMAGATLGTPAYMAPESIHGESGAPADVFALGIVLHEALAGRPLFTGDGPLATLYAIANLEAPPLRSVRAEVPEALEQLVARMLVKLPDERISAAEVAAALGGRSVPVSEEAETLPIERDKKPGGAASRPPWLAVSLTVLGVATVVALALALVVWPMIRTQRSQEALGINNRGIEALQRGDLDGARGLFERALRLDPSLGGAMINLGMVHLAQARPARAESLFTAALRRHPRDRALIAQARYNLGTIDLDAGAWESAAGNLGASFQIDSSSARIYNNYGLALVRVGRAADALDLLRRGITRFPSAAPLHKNAGLALIELGRAGDALPYLDRALALDSTLVEARRLREVARQSSPAR